MLVYRRAIMYFFALFSIAVVLSIDALREGRVEHEPGIDAAISEWAGGVGSEQAVRGLEQARVPAGPIYSVVDMFNDPHYQARGLFEQVEVNGQPLKIPAMVPKLSETPGRTDWPGGEVGEFNEEIYCRWLGISEKDLADLQRRGIV